MKLTFLIILLVAGIPFLAHTTITFKPFTIKFGSLWSAIGYFFIIIGCILIQIQGYKDGQQKAKEDEIIFDFEREQLKH